MPIGFIIQARLGSTRLPEKIIKPFHLNRSILEIIIENIKINFPDFPIIIATTTEERDDEICELGTRLNVHCFRGSENNVLERFVEASKVYRLSKIIRICSDNPFLDMKYMKVLVDTFNRTDVDYLSFSLNDGTPVIKSHFGLWAEGISFDALNSIKTNQNKYKEHVTNYLYENKDLFRVLFIELDEFYDKNKVRLTLDTYEDYILLKEIYNYSIRNNITDSKKMIDLIIKHPYWIKEMERQVKLNSK